MPSLRAAIVGAGLIASKKHIPAYLKHNNTFQLTAICDINAQAVQQVAQSFRIPHAYTDLSDMLAQEKPDLVDICTPPRTHAALAVQAMAHGCHVLIEKPMALTTADSDAIVHAARKYGVQVCVAHSDLFYWPFMQARELVARGAIGTFRGMRIFLSTPTDYMTSQPDHWAHKLPGGVIGETGPHVVYMSLAFLRDVREVNISTMKLLDYPWSPYDDYRIDILGENGISSIVLSYATQQWMARVDILGEEGTLLLDLEGMNLVTYKRKSLTPVAIGRSVLRESAQLLGSLFRNSLRSVTGTLHSTHETIIERFAESIQQGTAPPVTAEEGRETVRVLNMIVDKLQGQAG
jgi:predicted dehydrogenase